MIPSDLGPWAWLASAPRGYTADHPRIELLRMKDIFAGKTFPLEPWLRRGERSSGSGAP